MSDRSLLSYIPLDDITVRVPAFPIELYHDLSDPALRLRWLSAHRVRAALASGSLALLDELERPAERAKDIARRDVKVLSYLIRMSTRATPYGLLSGVMLAHWTPSTSIDLAQATRHTRTRPDMQWLTSLTRILETDAQIRRQLRWSMNSTATVQNGRVYLPEKAHTDQPPPYQSISLRATNVVLHTLELARTPIPYVDLVAALRDFAPKAGLAKITSLIDTLCEQTFLISDLRPPLTIPNPPRYIYERLSQIPEASVVCRYLAEVFDACAAWDTTCDQQTEAGYRALVDVARRTPSVVTAHMELTNAQSSADSIDPTQTFSFASRQESWYQVDQAWRTDAAHISAAIRPAVARAVEVMLRLSTRPTGLPHLEDFRRRFIERYGGDRLVPVLEAVDNQRGIGLPAHYTLGITAEDATPQRIEQRERKLLALAAEALAHNKPIFYLDDKLVEELSPEPMSLEQLPPSLDYFVAIAAKSATAIDQGDYLLVTRPGALRRPARSNLGRFADIVGEDASALMCATAAQEEHAHPEAIWAELTYLPPHSRAANISIVPQVRQHTILYNVSLVGETMTAIPLNELVLGVRQDRLVVYWTRTNQEVIVQCSHVLNHRGAPGLIRFLDDLHNDAVRFPHQFSWGPAEAFPYLPRVQYGQTVLRCAQWDIAASLFRTVIDTASAAAFTATFAPWRHTWQVPRYVYLLENDQRLLLDLEDVAHREILRNELHKQRDNATFVLTEALPGPTDAWVCGPEGHHLSECVVSLMRRDLVGASTAPKHEAASQHPTQAIPIEERLRPPGSDWLYLKLYVGRDYQQEMLVGPISELVDQIRAGGWTDKWFFIRYHDPDAHIRLRFHGDPDTLMHYVFPHLCRWGNDLLMRGLCVKYLFDVYDREIERYGGREAIDLAEDIFMADSMAVLRLLGVTTRGLQTLDPTDLAILTLDHLLATFEPSEEARRQFYRAYGASHPGSGGYFREHNRLLRPLLRPQIAVQPVSGSEVLTQILQERRVTLQHVAGQWNQLVDRGELSQPLVNLYGSLTHMHCNRLLGADRDRENLVRTMLDRLYEGLRRTALAR